MPSPSWQEHGPQGVLRQRRGLTPPQRLAWREPTPDRNGGNAVGRGQAIRDGLEPTGGGLRGPNLRGEHPCLGKTRVQSRGCNPRHNALAGPPKPAPEPMVKGPPLACNAGGAAQCGPTGRQRRLRQRRGEHDSQRGSHVRFTVGPRPTSHGIGVDLGGPHSEVLPAAPKVCPPLALQRRMRS